MLEDKIQNSGKFLFRFSREGDVMDQRSGDGRVSGRSKVIADARIASALNEIIQNSYFKKKDRKLRKKIGSFAEDRSLT